MKQIIFITSILLTFVCACKEKNARRGTVAVTTTELLGKTWDFGEITEGEIVTHTFYFRNTGEHPLMIKNVDSGCSCTTVKYETIPLAPGKEGKLEIAFNSEGRYGKQYKEISIFANIPEKQFTLSFTANVKE